MQSWLYASENRGKHKSFDVEGKNAIYFTWHSHSILSVDVCIREEKFKFKFGGITLPSDVSIGGITLPSDVSICGIALPSDVSIEGFTSNRNKKKC